jgi:hypothetical protein
VGEVLQFLENACCLLPFRKWITHFHVLLRENLSSQFMLRFLYELVHAPAFSGQDSDIITRTKTRFFPSTQHLR